MNNLIANLSPYADYDEYEDFTHMIIYVLVLYIPL